MNYKEILAENADINYERFKETQLKKSKEQIYDDSYKINFYSEMYQFFTECEDIGEDVCEFLCEDCDDNILDILYKEYLDMEYASVANWDDITEFVNNYYNNYNPGKGELNEVINDLYNFDRLGDEAGSGKDSEM